MDENQVASSNASQAGSEREITDTESQQPNPTAEASSPSEDKVDYASFHKAVSQKKALQARLAELEAQMSEEQSRKLESKQKYETLYQQEKERRAAVENQLGALRQAEVDRTKQTAVRSELMKLGLNPKHEATAFRLMDTSDVFIDEDSGRVLGAEDVARKFKEDFHDLGLFAQKTPGVSQPAPSAKQVTTSVPSGGLSKEEVIQQLKQLEGKL